MTTHTSKPSCCCCRWTLIASIVAVVALILGGFAVYKSMTSNLGEKEFNAKVESGINAFIAKKQAEQNGGPAAPTEPVDVSIDGSPMKGDKNAPVTMVEFSDFECPFCGRFAQQTLPQIVSDYIDKGKVRMVFRHFPLGFHQYAKTAALATECAKEQGGDEMFFKFHDKVYANQQDLNVESLKKWADELGLNTSKFDSCLDSKKFESVVDKDFSEGGSYGVSGTPAFFINGRFISGAQPISAFQTVIDEELAKVK